MRKVMWQKRAWTGGCSGVREGAPKAVMIEDLREEEEGEGEEGEEGEEEKQSVQRNQPVLRHSRGSEHCARDTASGQHGGVQGWTTQGSVGWVRSWSPS